jgi:hypothetical protein
METEQKPDLELKALGGFIGTQQYYREMGTLYTDGVKYIMENGYSWVVTDALAMIMCNRVLKAQPFLAVKLKRSDSEADLIIDDGNGKVLYRQHYDYTDAKRDLTLFWESGVLLLAGEH